MTSFPRRPLAAAGVAVLLAALLVATPNALAADPDLAPYRAFAQRLEVPYGPCDGIPALSDGLDRRALVDIALQGVELEPELVEGFITGMSRSLTLGETLCTSIGDTGSFELRHLEADGPGALALFRMIADEGEGFNFLRFRLRRESKAAPVRIVDFYSFISGEWMSETVRQRMAGMAEHFGRSVVERLRGQGGDPFSENVEAIGALVESFRQGDTAGFRSGYAELPPEVQKLRILLLLRMQVALQEGDDADYVATLEDIEAAFPDDPGLALTLVDHYFMREDYATARRRLRQVDREVGRDAQVLTLIAVTYTLEGDDAAAARELRRALELEPDFEDPYWSLLAITLAHGDWAATADLLDRVQRDAGVELMDLAEIPEYAAFLASDEGRRWRRRNPPPQP